MFVERPFSCKLSRDVTFGDVVATCAAAQARLGDGVVLAPEPITEGGIVFSDWPGKPPGAYKAVHFHSAGTRTYPTFDPGNIQSTDPGHVCYEKMARATRMDIVIKAFYGAHWTQEDLDAMADAMQACMGVKVVGRKRLRPPAPVKRRRCSEPSDGTS